VVDRPIRPGVVQGWRPRTLVRLIEIYFGISNFKLIFLSTRNLFFESASIIIFLRINSIK
jgi:hypothetical protein